MFTFDQFITQVKRVPRGRVATYGQIAALAGAPRAARMVGWALHQLGSEIDSVPWHRVVNREGRISTTCMDHPADYQAHLLRQEKVAVSEQGSNHFIDLKKYLWRPLVKN
ncbi:MAG: hypothetical protein A2722_00385 [Candidatus Doudnabacteria bacterium RIFCSPHIGHO2_01_FULL_50_11]|uniref:Methylated-DNA-[protein]-cysteine S-methyltransferase DNA binding domain-containing protein n=1 Tax=Candidatus Doudnabacteria bacterium RIFCSPHIGHO2_01_FULL_50_11 TaxID=1817828 RepID=A0A1F5PGY4_9BACT|nr:MAG: hypothetical protein A2722_00385 [Candidatus Doudnabacteria bacterium RIFCSPHIGHO2_01_FULL_50_11]HLC44732.1 MGMT family protein [Patescibacteria group bacterium]